MLENKTSGKKMYERLTADVFILAQNDVVTASQADHDVLKGQDTEWDFGYKEASI